MSVLLSLEYVQTRTKSQRPPFIQLVVSSEVHFKHIQAKLEEKGLEYGFAGPMIYLPFSERLTSIEVLEEEIFADFYRVPYARFDPKNSLQRSYTYKPFIHPEKKESIYFFEAKDPRHLLSQLTKHEMSSRAAIIRELNERVFDEELLSASRPPKS